MPWLFKNSPVNLEMWNELASDLFLAFLKEKPSKEKNPNNKPYSLM